MTEPRAEVVHVTDREEMISLWPLIRKTTLCDQGDHTDILINCLTGKFFMSKGVLDGKTVGIVVYTATADGSCFVSILQLPNHLKLFRDIFFDLCKQAGYKRILTSTSIDEAPYIRLTGLKRIYSVYEYDFTKEET